MGQPVRLYDPPHRFKTAGLRTPAINLSPKNRVVCDQETLNFALQYGVLGKFLAPAIRDLRRLRIREWPETLERNCQLGCRLLFLRPKPRGVSQYLSRKTYESEFGWTCYGVPSGNSKSRPDRPPPFCNPFNLWKLWRWLHLSQNRSRPYGNLLKLSGNKWFL